jgi:hypothetical protein
MATWLHRTGSLQVLVTAVRDLLGGIGLNEGAVRNAASAVAADRLRASDREEALRAVEASGRRPAVVVARRPA